MWRACAISQPLSTAATVPRLPWTTEPPPPASLKTFLDRHPGMGSIGLLWSCIYYHKMHYTNYLSTIFARPRLCCCCEVCSPAVRVSTPARVFVCSLARVSSSDLRVSAPPVNRIRRGRRGRRDSRYFTGDAEARRIRRRRERQGGSAKEAVDGGSGQAPARLVSLTHLQRFRTDCI